MTSGSYWQRDARDRWVGLALPSAVDFAVIGGGFAGLATAIRLRERHPQASIALLEAERVGAGASGRNAGFLTPLPAPVWLLSPEHAWGAARINAEVHGVARWIDALAIDCELARVQLRFSAPGRIAARALRELMRAVERAGVTLDAYTLHPYELVAGLATHADRAGVMIREGARVRRIEGVRAGGSTIHVDGGRVHATKVIACTNAYSSAIDFGEPRPAALVVHSAMGATAPHGADDARFTVEVNAVQAYHRTHAGRVIYGGLDTLHEPSARDHAKLARHAGLTFEETWSGRFHATPNGLPIIRTSDANNALVWNIGYGGTGVALALACARLVACVASNGTWDTADDPRLLALMHATTIPVRAALGALARIVLH